MKSVYKVEMVHAAAVVPSPYQSRKHFDAVELQGLAENIVAGGLLHPIVVRMVDGVPELIAGERRLRAWRLVPDALGTVIPARVIEVDDTTAAEMVVTENMQRVDLTPLEEASGIAALLSTGKSKDEVAAVLGRSCTWVVRRANLINLADVVKDGLDDESSPFFGMGLCCLEAIAKYPVSLQVEAVDKYSHMMDGVPQIERAFGWLLSDLDEACFDVSECAGCANRTGAESDLFDHVEGLGRCMRPDCFHGKEIAFFQLKVEEVKGQYPGMMIFGAQNSVFVKCEGVKEYWKDKGFVYGHEADSNPDAFEVVFIDDNFVDEKLQVVTRIAKVAPRVEAVKKTEPLAVPCETLAEIKAREAKEREAVKVKDRIAAFALKRLKGSPFAAEAMIERDGVEKFLTFIITIGMGNRWPDEREVRKAWKEVGVDGRKWIKDLNKNMNQILMRRLACNARDVEAIGQAEFLFGDTKKVFLAAVEEANKGKGKKK